MAMQGEALHKRGNPMKPKSKSTYRISRQKKLQLRSVPLQKGSVDLLYFAKDNMVHINAYLPFDVADVVLRVLTLSRN
jgi:hypothetical protein